MSSPRARPSGSAETVASSLRKSGWIVRSIGTSTASFVKLPLRTEVINTFELLISDRSLDMRQDGVETAVAFKDQVLARLLWDNLSIPELICMPLSCEPMIVTFDDRNSAGREAWKITLELRHAITG